MSASRKFPKLLMVLPILLAFAVLGLYLFGLTFDPNRTASRVIGKRLPEFSAPSLFDTETRIDSASIKGPALISIWASWCAACRDEHPLLMELAEQEGLSVYGVNYQDELALAKQWLQDYGNPFTWVMFDSVASLGLALDVFSLPQTYFINEHGVVVARHVGALTPDVWARMRQE